MNHLEEAKLLRQEPGGRHYNCAQSLLVPFAAEKGVTRKENCDGLVFDMCQRLAALLTETP